jgi:glycosyltransferase involved in cell wall biosynthesis
MYLFDVPKAIYADPWNASIETRLEVLRKGQRRVAYIYLWPDYYVFRYRVYNMIQALQLSDQGTSAAYFTQTDLAFIERIVDIADVIVVCRTKFDIDIYHILTLAKARGKTVFFDVDDLVFDVKFIPLLMKSHNIEMNDPKVLENWFAHIGRISETMQFCDRAIATNGYLAAKLRPYFGKKVSVIPNFLNREQMIISEQIYQAKKSANFARSDRIHLGYFSGTPSHDRDFEVAADGLAQILERYPQVSLQVVGLLNIPDSLLEYSSQIERYPIQDFINLQRTIGQVEINIIPLQDNQFTNCKSELKYFEAGIAGTSSIATPIYSYKNAIEDGINGLLADPSEWAEKIQRCIDDLSSPVASEMAEKAFLHSKQNYAWYNQTKLIENALFSNPDETITPDDDKSRSESLETRPQLSINTNEFLIYSDVLKWLQSENKNLQIKINESDRVMRSLSGEVAEIHGSRAWKLINLLWSVRVWLIPHRSKRELALRFCKGMISNPKAAINKSIGKIKRIPIDRKTKLIQNDLMKKNFQREASDLIVFLVPGVDAINGGLMSICSLAKVTKSLKEIHHSDVFIATLPRNPLFLKYTYFDNPFDIYRFEQLHNYFINIQTLTLHLPENFVSRFLLSLRRADREFLKGLPKLTINILNQNIWLMPSQETVDQLKQLTKTVTCTTAHSRYCTSEMRRHFGIPFHNFSASNMTNYYYSTYENKENLMIISNDEQEFKEKILEKINNDHPEISIHKIEHMAYEDYKRLLSRAKWAITFGEGLDGYFAESIRSGAIPFAVYNKDFFTDRFQNLPNIYQSYEEMLYNISQNISRLNKPALFKGLSDRLIELDKQEYDDDKYKDNITRYYLGCYDIP